tara:strand:+ start:473 stop:811 length:339 start_codon:yes stop_codon:yes gene_type:complete
MTDKLEPCRAMIGGKFCGADPMKITEDGTTNVSKYRCSADITHSLHWWTTNNAGRCDDWNAIQLDRLDAARWREFSKRLDRGHYECCAEGFGFDQDVTRSEIDAAIGEKGGT